MMKKIWALVVALFAVFSFIACTENESIGIIGGADGPTEIIVSTSADETDEISEAILSYNKGHYLEGECVAEGHLILTDKTENEKRVVSLFASYACPGSRSCSCSHTNTNDHCGTAPVHIG